MSRKQGHNPNHQKNLQVDPTPKSVTTPNSTKLETKPSVCGSLGDTPALDHIGTLYMAEDEDGIGMKDNRVELGMGLSCSSACLASTSPWMGPRHGMNQVCLGFGHKGIEAGRWGVLIILGDLAAITAP